MVAAAAGAIGLGQRVRAVEPGPRDRMVLAIYFSGDFLRDKYGTIAAADRALARKGPPMGEWVDGDGHILIAKGAHPYDQTAPSYEAWFRVRR